MKLWSNWSIKTWVQVLIIGCLCMLGASVAAAATEGKGKKTDYAQGGELLLWLEQLDTGLKKLVVQHQATGEIIEVTNGATAVDAPYTNGEWIVWADKGNESLSSLNWEIHGYHVPSGKKQKISREAGSYGNPTVDEYGVVWYKRSAYGEMIYSDLQSGVEFSLGEGRFPVLADRKVVYKNARDGGLSMLDLSSGVKRNLVTLGSTYYIDWFVFNGTHVLAKENDGYGNSQFKALHATAPAIAITELTELSSDAGSYNAMFISQHNAVYMELIDGIPTLHSVELDTMTKSEGMKIPAKASVVGMLGNKLLLEHEDGTVSAVSQEELTEEKLPSPSPIAPPLEETETSRYIDANGGVIETEDGLANVTFPEDAFTTRTKVSLFRQQQTGTAYDEAGRVLQLASGIYTLELATLPSKAATLSLAITDHAQYDDSLEKLAIYSWNEEQQYWSYIGGGSNTAKNEIQTSINEAGQYAVMLRNISFSDISGHWAQDEIEILASRGIVNGVSSSRYAPGQILTRAEFTKLLASAIGLKQVEGGASSFSDVSPDAWYYGWIEAAASAGIVQGNNGLFKPQDALTREQMMTMLIRAADYQLSGNLSTHEEEVLTQFEDYASISSWAQSHVARAVQMGLIQGTNGRIEPLGLSNRAQAAIVIYRLCKLMNTI